MTNAKNIKVRFAPSPTGLLHIGGLRTALYNYLFAKQNGGKFILRIEDTDRERYREDAEKNILDTLRSFNLNWDEGPIKQSENLSKYKKYADDLIERKLAYKDYTRASDLEALKEKEKLKSNSFKFTKSMATLEGSGDFVVRLEIPESGSTSFCDLIRGDITFENDKLEDFILIKSDGYPTYNFANVIDDHEMNITHVIRGEEFVSSTPKHILLYKAFGWETPEFAHLPLLLNKNRAKLSKRENDVSVFDFLSKGYIENALLNFVSLLGWHPSNSEKEIYSLDDLIAEFKLTDVQKAGAIFDLEKLKWFQKTWAQKLEKELNGDVQKHPLYKKLYSFFEEKFENINDKLFILLWPHILERSDDPNEYYSLSDEFDYFFRVPAYRSEILIWKKSDKENTLEALKNVKKLLVELKDEQWSASSLEKIIKDYINNNNLDTGTVLWPLRVTLSGKEKSMGPFEIMEILNQSGKKSEIFERIEKAIANLE